MEAFWKLLLLDCMQSNLMAHVCEVGCDVAEASAEVNGMFYGLVRLVWRVTQGSDDEQLDALEQRK
jgi:hypothetical protein